MAALRRHSICRALRQSLSLISSSFQPRYVNTDLCQQGRGCSASNVVSVEGKCNRHCVLPVFWNGGFRSMSSQGRGIRSRVEKRMRKETGRTLREIRRAKKLRKKLMTEDERLIFSLRRAKKKVALLLQKLKKYELPELPPSRHDPELFTPEQLQAIKKVGFKNRNYVPIGVRGVFGGVVQNMHLHWKFHETVQVCCDTLPKEKIKETAIMLARLSGGVVVNIHDVKTIIMFRGRNYRQPKILIPINTLTKRKALFKARFEQALESQKINIRKIEQQLRRLGVNPEDPIAMGSVQKVASTFFRAIDEKQGTPYVFHGNKEPLSDTDMQETQCPSEDSDQEELDRFIAEIEKAADDEWAAEEAAEKEETGKIRYWNKPAIDDNWNSEDMSGRIRRGAMDVRRVMDREEDVDDEGRRGQRDMDDKGRRAQGGIFDKNRRAQRDMFDRTRRSKDMEDDWNSDGSVLDKDRRNMRNIGSDWDTEDEADEEGRGHKSDMDDPLESESESEIVYDNNRCQGTGRIDQRNMADRTLKGQIYTSDRSIKGRHIDDDWDSEDEEVDRDRTMMGSMNDDGDTEDEVADKSGECKSDMYDYWSSEEEVDDNVRRGEMVMRDDSDCEEVVGRGRRQEIDGDKDWDDASKTVDSNRRKKHIDESWDSD